MAGNRRRTRSKGYIFFPSAISRSHKHSKLESIYDSLHKSVQPFFLVKEINGKAVVGSIEQYDEFFTGVASEKVISAFPF